MTEGDPETDERRDSPPVVQAKAKETGEIALDDAGYFLISPEQNDSLVRAEHYSYDDELLRVIEGKRARDVYWTIIDNGWVTHLGHAAYLGKELTRAELSLYLKFTYVQRG